MNVKNSGKNIEYVTKSFFKKTTYSEIRILFSIQNSN